MRERNINIVIMQLIKAEYLLPQRDIAVHVGKMTVDSVNKGIIDRHRDVFHSHSHLKGRSVMAHARLRGPALHDSRIRRGKRVIVRLEPIVKTPECMLSQSPVRGLLEQNEICLREFMFLARAVFYRCKLEIRILKTVRNFLRCLEDLAEICHDLFFLCRKNVRFLIDQLL